MKGKTVKTVKAYQTKDGKIFTDKEEAEDHEYFLDMPQEIQKLHILDENPLTEQEKKVFNYLVKTSLQGKQIADNLGITPRTVKAHCTKIYQKMGVVDRLELVFKTLDIAD